MTQSVFFKFRLYMAGDAQNSMLARANLRALCGTYLAGCHEIEVLDVFQDRQRAMDDNIFMTPTLLIIAPAKERRIVGTLSQTEAVLLALGLDDSPA